MASCSRTVPVWASMSGCRTNWSNRPTFWADWFQSLSYSKALWWISAECESFRACFFPRLPARGQPYLFLTCEVWLPACLSSLAKNYFICLLITDPACSRLFCCIRLLVNWRFYSDWLCHIWILAIFLTLICPAWSPRDNWLESGLGPLSESR